MDFEAREDDLLESMLLDTTAEPILLPLSLLKSITNNFSNDQVIGKGGFSVVYKGRLRNRIVAVKRLSIELDMDEKTFKNELISLIRMKHENIVRFLGYCVDTQGKVELYQRDTVIADIRQRLLCFEFLPNGGLDKHIDDKSCGIEWGTCYQIIKGICMGLHYLHQQNIVHGDLKPANILLDDDMVPKIADFGQSRCFDENQTRAITRNMIGTLGYMAPEFIHSKVITLKSDIYSLGIIIIEVLTGQKWYLHLQIENILEIWRTRFRTSLGSTWAEYARVCAEIGLKCVDSDYMKRPDMQHIIESLDKLECLTLMEIDTTRSSDRPLQTSKEIGELEFIITTPEPSHPSLQQTSEEICEQKPAAPLPEPSHEVEIEMDTARSSDRRGQTSKDIGKQESIISQVRIDTAENPEVQIFQALRLFGGTRGVCAMCHHLGRNYESIHQEPKPDHHEKELENIKDTTQCLCIGSVLIATVALGALPGGYRQDDDTPNFAGRYAFHAFVMANTFAFVFSAMATVALMYSGSPIFNTRIRKRCSTSAYVFMDIWCCLCSCWVFGVGFSCS